MATTAVLRHRRDTAANWTSNNPVLQAGQLGYETDTLKFKFGNGTTTWASLSYASSISAGGISDGDKGDIVVSGSGATWTIDTGVVSTSKMGGDVTTAGKALLDDADATAQRVTLGLGSIATQNANAVSITGGTLTGVIVSTGAYSSNVNETLMKLVRKSTAGTITKGQAVYVVGSTGTHLTVELADASSEATAATTIGIAAETITNTTDGYMIVSGLLTGLSTLPTASFTNGDILWLSETAGALTATRPTQPAHGVAMGFVINASNGSAGAAYIKVINGQELNELHDVLIVSATADNVLMYDTATSLWKNRSAGYLSTLITGFASASHAHSTGDITSGIFAPSFLGSGSPSSTNFLRGDGSWAVPAGGGGVAIAASTQTATSGTINFANSNGITFGMSGSNQITASHNGLTNVNVSAGTTSDNLSNLVFSNSNGVSFGLSGSTITASVPGSNATSSLVGVNGISISTTGSTISISNAQYTLSGYNHYNDVVQSIGAVGQGSLIFDPIDLANAVQFDRFGMMLFNSNSSNSSGSHTISFWIGLYTKSISTLSLFQSTSTTIAVTHSGTAGSYSLYSGVRQLTVPFTTTLSANAYWLGVVSRTTSGGANGSYSQLQQSNLNSDYRGFWGSAVNATNQISVGQGLYTATTAGLPGSVAFSQINGTAAVAFRPPVVIFQSGTV